MSELNWNRSDCANPWSVQSLLVSRLSLISFLFSSLASLFCLFAFILSLVFLLFSSFNLLFCFLALVSLLCESGTFVGAWCRIIVTLRLVSLLHCLVFISVSSLSLFSAPGCLLYSLLSLLSCRCYRYYLRPSVVARL